MTKATNMSTYGAAKAIAQMNSAPMSSPCHTRRAGRTAMARPMVSACCVTLMLASPELHYDLREDLVAPLEGLIDGVGYLHTALDHVGMGLAPELLGVGLAPGRREPLID